MAEMIPRRRDVGNDDDHYPNVRRQCHPCERKLRLDSQTDRWMELRRRQWRNNMLIEPSSCMPTRRMRLTAMVLLHILLGGAALRSQMETKRAHRSKAGALPQAKVTLFVCWPRQTFASGGKRDKVKKTNKRTNDLFGKKCHCCCWATTSC